MLGYRCMDSAGIAHLLGKHAGFAKASVDLVPSALRYSTFIMALAQTGWLAPETWLSNSNTIPQMIQTYSNFLILHKESNTLCVPTLGIELVWDTCLHMASKYRKDTEAVMGKILDRADAVDEGAMKAAIHSTSRRWKSCFGTLYTTSGQATTETPRSFRKLATLYDILPTLAAESPFLLAGQTILTLVPYPSDPNPTSPPSKALRSAASAELARQTTVLIDRIISQRPTVECVQALAMLSTWEWGSGWDLEGNWDRGKRAVQVAMALGLHEQDKERGRISAERLDWQADLSRRTWWVVYSAQLYAAIVSGRDPVIGPDDPRIRVDFPICSIQDNAWSNWDEERRRRLVEVDREVTEIMKLAGASSVVDLAPGGEEEVVRNLDLSGRSGLALTHIHVHRQQAFPGVSLFSKRLCGLPQAPDFSADTGPVRCPTVTASIGAITSPSARRESDRAHASSGSTSVSSASTRRRGTRKAWGVDSNDRASVVPLLRPRFSRPAAAIAMFKAPPKLLPFCACGLVAGAYAFLLLALAVQAEKALSPFDDGRGDEVDALLTNVEVIHAGLNAYGVMWAGVESMANEICARTKETLLGLLAPEQAKASTEAFSKLGRLSLTTIPFQSSLHPTDFEVPAALQLRTLAGECEAHLHRLRLEPLGHQTSRRNGIQLITLLGSQAPGLANADCNLTVVSLASKHAHATSLPEHEEHGYHPLRLVNKYLDSVADHKVRHRPTSNLPFHPIVLSLGGMMNGSTTKVFASWKRVMTRGTYNLVLNG
ncbi:hypothetical protein JCM24511_02077 [Saitozyma sp. JCM 24511]|nr:hypothetical protein JCM24511_02077 [Saitozyma sp. JCM 24511]